MKLTGSVIAVAISIGVAKFFLFPAGKNVKYLPWHNTIAWERLLKIYDELEELYYSPTTTNCENKLIETSFGQTKVHACGLSTTKEPPVLLFHGAGSNSLIYGDWIQPALTNSHSSSFEEDDGMFTMSVDYPCDTGRSIPKDGKVENCPSSEKEIALWVKEIVDAFELKTPVSLVGYSYGTLISFVTAEEYPELIHKMVLLATPMLGPLSIGFVIRAIIYSFFPSDRTHNWFMNYMASSALDFDLYKFDRKHTEHMIAIRELGATVLSVNFPEIGDERLRKVFTATPTLVISGAEEVLLTNITHVLQRAKDAGANKVMEYPRAGHLMLIEEPARGGIEKDVVDFLRYVPPTNSKNKNELDKSELQEEIVPPQKEKEDEAKVETVDVVEKQEVEEVAVEVEEQESSEGAEETTSTSKLETVTTGEGGSEEE